MSTEATAGAIYKRLLTYLGPQKWYFLLSIIGFAMFAASAPALAHLMGVVEETLNEPTQENIFLLVSALFAVYLFRGIGTFLGKYFTALVGREIVHALRTMPATRAVHTLHAKYAMHAQCMQCMDA